MLRKGSRLRRGVRLGLVCGAATLGLIAVTWGGGAVAAALEQRGKGRATAQVLAVHTYGHPDRLTIRYTVRDGREVEADMNERHGEDVAEGERIEVLYDPDDPEGAQRYRPLGSAPVVVLSFAAGAAVLGAAAYRLREKPAA